MSISYYDPSNATRFWTTHRYDFGDPARCPQYHHTWGYCERPQSDSAPAGIASSKDRSETHRKEVDPHGVFLRAKTQCVGSLLNPSAAKHPSILDKEEELRASRTRARFTRFKDVKWKKTTIW